MTPAEKEAKRLIDEQTLLLNESAEATASGDTKRQKGLQKQLAKVELELSKLRGK